MFCNKRINSLKFEPSEGLICVKFLLRTLADLTNWSSQREALMNR